MENHWAPRRAAPTALGGPWKQAAAAPVAVQGGAIGCTGVSLRRHGSRKRHWTPDGLPVGAQLVAAANLKDLLLSAGAQLERALP